jgi:dienelactone hydrolase
VLLRSRSLGGRDFVLFGWALSASVLAGYACGLPSSEVDGGDLHGVFAFDGGPDARADAGRRSGRRPAKDAGTGPAVAVDAGVRAPGPGLCVAPQGEPDRDIRRTVGRPGCRDAEILEWKDAEGSPRYACVVGARGAEARAPLPAILFFHASGDDPTMVDKKTQLRKLASSFDLAGDGGRRGFLVIAVQGRSIKGGRLGATFDVLFTDETNVDIAAADHFLGQLEARRLVDRRRVYALGASHGGIMAATYAMARADRVAAFAAFAADAPRAAWSCPGPPPPGMVVYRACDAFFSCESVERWLRAREALSAETAFLRLGAGNEEEPNCSTKNRCTETKGAANHRRWPKGREEDILKFFARHALGASEPRQPGPDAGP